MAGEKKGTVPEDRMTSKKHVEIDYIQIFRQTNRQTPYGYIWPSISDKTFQSNILANKFTSAQDVAQIRIGCGDVELAFPYRMLKIFIQRLSGKWFMIQIVVSVSQMQDKGFSNSLTVVCPVSSDGRWWLKAPFKWFQQQFTSFTRKKALNHKSTGWMRCRNVAVYALSYNVISLC